MKIPSTPNVCEELLKLGVTCVTEKWHSLYVCEFILEGDYDDDAVHECIYKYTPSAYTMVGDVVMENKYGAFVYKAGFTRKEKA